MAKLKDGFYKQTAESIGSDLHVLLAGGGSKALSDFATISEVVTALGTNGNYVTWTKNGTANNLTVPYATTSSSASTLTMPYLTTQEQIDSFLESSKFKVSCFKTTEQNNVGFASNDGMLLSIPWTSTTYGAQLAIDDTLDGTMKIRTKSTTWGSWYKFWHTGNLTKVSQLTNDAGYLTSLPSHTHDNYLPRHTYTIPKGKSVRITFAGQFNAIIYGRCTLGSGSLILIGNGYGENRIRNSWTQLSNGVISWSVPNSDSYSKTIEIQGISDHPVDIEVLSKVTPTFTEISALTSSIMDDPVALRSQIPTKTSQLTNDSGYITSYTDTAAGKTFKTLSSVSHSGWTNNTTDDKILPTMSFIAYWNGAYASNNASNLLYSANGIIIGSSNYTTYTVKKDGTGATGTWGINISGNAGSANIIKGVNGSDSGGSVVYYKISNLLEKKSNYQATYIITTRNTENYYISIGIDDGGWFTPDITRMHNNYSKITNFAWKDGVLYVKSNAYNNGIRITCLTNSSSIIPVISSSNATEFDAATVIPIKTNIHSGNIGSYAITAHQSLANYVTLDSAQTISGVKTFSGGNVPIKLNSTGNEVGVQFLLNGTAKGWVGYTNTTGTYIYNYPSAKYIGVKDDGTPYYYSGGFKTLLHTGNAPYVQRLYARNDFEYYVVLLCKYGTGLTGVGHRASGKIYSEGAGVGRYVAADVDIWVADWSSGYDSKLRFDTYGTQEMDLVTCTYGGTKYLAIRIAGSQAKTVYFEGTSTEMLFTPIQYYNNSTGAVSNSEIYNSISPVSVSQPYSNGIKYALVSEIPAVTNYYWANVPISATSNSSTSPTFANATTTGLLTVSTGGSHCGIKAGSTYINSISSDLILQNNGAIRFGTDSWDYNCWAGLKYVHSSKTISLGLADGTHFTANTAQSGGTMQFPGIGTFRLNGTVHINPPSGSYVEGIRIHPSSAGWTALVFCGDDNTADSGTSAKTWGLFTNRGNFYINKNNSNTSTGHELCNVSGNWGIGTISPIHKLHVDGAGVFKNTGSTTYASDGITIGAGDYSGRYITCYGKTSISYINFGHSPAANNCGELYFSYSSSGSTSNYAALSLYGAANTIYVYPDYTKSAKYITAPNYTSSTTTGTQPYACNSTTLNTNLNADLLDGEHGSRYTKALGSPNYISFTVGGNANTFYPVVISSVSSKYPMQFVNISRGYSETAPDSWNTATHKGGLTLTLLWNGSRYWDGNSSGGACYCVYKNESYSTMVGGLGNSTTGKVVWLRGGGAVYHVHAMNGTSVSATVYTSTFTDSASQSFAPTTSVKSYSVRWPGYAEGADYATSAGSASSASTVTVGDLNANSTYRMVWHSGNTLYGTGGIYCNPSTDYLYAASMNASDWFRSSGNTGWYNASYDGGWYMSDSTWVRSYNSKGVVAGGYYHTSYGSSAYALTSDGGAAHIGSMSVNYANSAGSAGSASYAHYLPTKYDGGQQTNPQTYFNNGIGLRVAMTGLSSKGTSYWSDTLWINGYSGGDVPNMCALHFNRDGTPRAFISTQSNQSSSYGTLYELITGYNIGSQSVNYATYSRYVYCTSGSYLNFQWSGQSGQPTWLFGSNDGANVYVWNPSNFSVNYANSAGSATNATNASNVYINTSATSSYCPVPFVTSTGAGNKALYIDSSTGTASSSAGVRYNPSSNALYCSGGFFEYSDETAKIFFNDIPVDFDILKRIPKKYFVWKDSHNTALQIGTSAQKLQEMYPELVTTVNGKLAVSYEKLSVVALKAIDELYDMIVELKQELNYYKTK